MKTQPIYTVDGCRIYENGQPMMICGPDEANAIAARLNEEAGSRK